jgi:transcriptional regulator with XRE-family HTH domain
LSLQAVADHFSLAKATIGHWETGKNPPDLGTLFRLARFYECPLLQLLSEPMNAEQLVEMLRQAVAQQPAPPPVPGAGAASQKQHRAAA